MELAISMAMDLRTSLLVPPIRLRFRAFTIISTIVVKPISSLARPMDSAP